MSPFETQQSHEIAHRDWHLNHIALFFLGFNEDDEEEKKTEFVAIFA